MFYSTAFKNGVFGKYPFKKQTLLFRRGREGLRKLLLNMDIRLSGENLISLE